MAGAQSRGALCVGSFGLALVLAGCRAAPRESEPFVFFPSPPEKPRVQFLTWASGAEQVEPTQGSFERFVLGEDPSAQRSIVKPYGVAAHDGVVYVCDTKGLSVCRLDFKDQTYSVLGVSGPGRLKKPINIAIDKAGYKFVVDSVREQLVVFGPDDRYVAAHDIPKPCHPVDLALYGSEVYILDNDESCQIVVLDRSTGEVIRSFGGPGGEPGQFKKPNSLSIGPEGYLYVSDTHNWRVQKLTRQGESIWVKGTPGYMLGQFGRPRGIRVGPDGVVYVVDGATEIVQMFNAEGQTLMRFGGPGDAPGSLGLPSTLAIDTTSLPYFQQFVHEDFTVEYLLFVASQYGARLINVYAYGSFPEGYELAESEFSTIERLPPEEGIGPVEGEDTAEDPAVLKARRQAQERD